MPMATEFTSVEDIPLHANLELDPARGEGTFWACADPERPPVLNGTRWDYRCRSCCVHAWAAVKAGFYPSGLTTRDVDDGTLGHRKMTQAEVRQLIADALEQHGIIVEV